MTPFAAWVALSSLSDWFVASRLLGVRLIGRVGGGRMTRLSLPRVLIAVAATTAFFVGKLLLLPIGRGAGVFGVMALAYADLAIVLPLLGLAVLRAGRRGRRVSAAPAVTLSGAVRAGAMLALLPAPICAYATFVEPYWLVVERTTITAPAERLAGSDGAIRLAVLADLQTSHVDDYDRRAIARLMALEPDVILIAGDTFGGDAAAWARELSALHELLGMLHAPGGVYAVEGDADEGQLEPLLRGTGIRALHNEITVARVRGAELIIGGIELNYLSESSRRVMEHLSAPPAGAAGPFRILLAHRPDPVLYLERDAAIDLVVAGHTHGGQVQIPGFGPPVTFSKVPRRSAAGGLSRVNGHALYVSRGVGHERGAAPRIRLFCRPEISLITLQPQADGGAGPR